MKIKIAETAEEYHQIHRLNHDTFAVEIPQHKEKRNSEGILIDKFHDRNTYIIAVDDQELMGMISLNSERPFSLDQKLSNLDSYLPPYSKLCEIRLLSVKKDMRGKRVFFGLMAFLKRYAEQKGIDMAVISGTTRQIKLYESIGFRAFGPLTGTADAQFQPMYLSSETLKESLKQL